MKHLVLIQIQRNPKRSFLTVLLAFCMVVLLGIYANVMIATKQSLAQLSQSIPIQAQVSDLSGTRFAGLEITTKQMEYLLSLDYVSNAKYSARANGSLHDQNGNDFLSIYDLELLGVNDLSLLPMDSLDTMTYVDGVDASFLQGEKANCIISEALAQSNQITLGQQFMFSLYTIHYQQGSTSFSLSQVQDVEVTVVGIMKNQNKAAISSNIIVPVKWLRDTVENNHQTFYYDSMRFHISDGLQLNAFKEELKEHGFTEVNREVQEQTKGSSMLIHDRLFIDQANKLQQNLVMFQQFQFPFFILVCLLVALITFLLMRSRRLEIAIASSLGKAKKRITYHLFLELECLNVIGCMLGFILLYMITSLNIVELLGYVSIYLFISSIGILVSLYFLFQFQIMQSLSCVE